MPAMRLEATGQEILDLRFGHHRKFFGSSTGMHRPAFCLRSLRHGPAAFALKAKGRDSGGHYLVGRARRQAALVARRVPEAGRSVHPRLGARSCSTSIGPR